MNAPSRKASLTPEEQDELQILEYIRYNTVHGLSQSERNRYHELCDMKGDA